MEHEMRQSCAKRALQFGILADRILDQPGKVSRPVIRQLAKFKRQFKASANDHILGEKIQSDLKVLAEVELFIKARNTGDEVAEKRHRNEAIRLWDEGDVITNRIIEEVDKNV